MTDTRRHPGGPRGGSCGSDSPVGSPKAEPAGSGVSLAAARAAKEGK